MLVEARRVRPGGMDDLGRPAARSALSVGALSTRADEASRPVVAAPSSCFTSSVYTTPGRYGCTRVFTYYKYYSCTTTVATTIKYYSTY